MAFEGGDAPPGKKVQVQQEVLKLESKKDLYFCPVPFQMAKRGDFQAHVVLLMDVSSESGEGCQRVPGSSPPGVKRRKAQSQLFPASHPGWRTLSVSIHEDVSLLQGPEEHRFRNLRPGGGGSRRRDTRVLLKGNGGLLWGLISIFSKVIKTQDGAQGHYLGVGVVGGGGGNGEAKKENPEKSEKGQEWGDGRK